MGNLGIRKRLIALPLGRDINLEDMKTLLSAIQASSELANLIGYIEGDWCETEDEATALVDIIAQSPNLIHFAGCMPTLISFHTLLERLQPSGLSKLRFLNFSCSMMIEEHYDIPLDEMVRLLQLLPALKVCFWKSGITHYERLPESTNAAAHYKVLFPETLRVYPRFPAKAAIPILSMPNSAIRSTSVLGARLEDQEFLRTVDWTSVSLHISSLELCLNESSAGPDLYSSLLSACQRLQFLMIDVRASCPEYTSILRAILSVEHCRLRTLFLSCYIAIDYDHVEEEPGELVEHPFPAVVGLLRQAPPAISALRVLWLGYFGVPWAELEPALGDLMAFCAARRIRCSRI